MNAPTVEIVVQAASFDPGAELNGFCAGAGVGDAGGVASFIGLVRDLNLGDRVAGLYLEHYPGMTERALEDIGRDATRRWSLLRVRVIHRFGDLAPGDPIVAVLCASAHRAEAFAACQFIMDYLKTGAPFWKRERTTAGERWVAARASDEAAAHRWDAGSPAHEPDGSEPRHG